MLVLAHSPSPHSARRHSHPTQTAATSAEAHRDLARPTRLETRGRCASFGLVLCTRGSGSCCFDLVLCVSSTQPARPMRLRTLPEGVSHRHPDTARFVLRCVGCEVHHCFTVLGFFIFVHYLVALFGGFACPSSFSARCCRLNNCSNGYYLWMSQWPCAVHLFAQHCCSLRTSSSELDSVHNSMAMPMRRLSMLPLNREVRSIHSLPHSCVGHTCIDGSPSTRCHHRTWLSLGTG